MDFYWWGKNDEVWTIVLNVLIWTRLRGHHTNNPGQLLSIYTTAVNETSSCANSVATGRGNVSPVYM